MKHTFSPSFRVRLFAALLLVSLAPTLLCSLVLAQVFRVQVTDSSASWADEQSALVMRLLDTAFEGFADAAQQLDGINTVSAALGGSADGTEVYSKLFAATENVRDYAAFTLCDLDGIPLYSTRQLPSGSNALPTNWGVLHAADYAGKPITYVADDASDSGSPLFQGAVKLTDGTGGDAGYLLISMYRSDFSALLDGKYGAQYTLLLASRYWRPVYCEQTSLASTLVPELRQRLLNGEDISSASDDFLYSAAYHEASGLYLILRQPMLFTSSTSDLLFTISGVCALICVAVAVLLSFSFSRQLSRPIQQLNSAMTAVEQNRLDVQLNAERGDELGQLARRFNGMVVSLRRNQEQLVENQRELNEAQIRMLQAQLNPHFLCNTLDTMKWISKINRVPQVALMSTDLADMLRFCISADERVPLRREAEILERYIELQKIRLSDSFAFSMHLPAELEDCLVPKMILQPIVENAILHGLCGKENGGITVDMSETWDGLLTITVADNGRGFPPDMLGPYRGKSREGCGEHLGLYNVDTILGKYYGESFGLVLTNAADGACAVVTATLPIQREGN
ncbi:MAG: sensor histidine kinase [Oscillospiraceae bacterium]|nr:sensor histidine kinase [Oscillospiraceae bacterium]